MLEHSEVHANVPAADLKRARIFYTETLGLTPSREDDYTVRFPTPSGSWFQIYETSYAGTGKHTVAQFEVADLTTVVRELRAKGVTFETYDMPGVEWDREIASMGGLRVAWFIDSEGNTLCLDEQTEA